MQNKTRKILDTHAQGFTLIELLMTLAIAMVVMTAIYSIFVSSNRSYRTQDSVADAQQRVRIGIDFMVDDIRMAGMDPTGSGNFGIENNTATNLQFTSDLNLNGAVDAATERFTYALVGGNLQRRLGAGGFQTLIDNVSGVTFTYLNSAGTVTGTPANIRSVRIILTCQGTNSQGGTFTRRLATRVICRNLFLGGG